MLVDSRAERYSISQTTDLLTSLRCVEVLWPYWSSKHDIIIEVDEPAECRLTHSSRREGKKERGREGERGESPLAEAWDAVNVSLYCWRTDGR